MSILDDLAKSLTTPQTTQERAIMPDGLHSMSDAAFVQSLKDHGCDDIGIKEWLLEDVANRSAFIKQMENNK
jgi:hypothetical protein